MHKPLKARQRHCYHWLDTMLAWHKSTGTPLRHYILIHPTLPGCTPDCSGVQWCTGPDLEGEPQNTICPEIDSAYMGAIQTTECDFEFEMKFHHSGPACCLILLLWFWECLWIQPPVGWSFSFPWNIWHPSIPNKLCRDVNEAWFFSN